MPGHVLRYGILGLLICANLPASAAGPTETYLAIRDQAIAQLASHEGVRPGIDPMKVQDEAIAKMQPLIRQIVGPIGIKGFPQDGESNVITLTEEEGFGQLDGLTSNSADRRTTALVTTEPLLRAWLKANSNRQNDPSDNPPIEPAEAFRSGPFYTYAMSSGIAATVFGVLPVTAPPGAIANGVVLFFSQDTVAPHTPDMIGAAMMRDGRVFLMTEMAKTRIAPINPCKTDYLADQKAAKKITARSTAGGGQNGSPADLEEKAEKAAELTYISCFAAKLPQQKYYPALVRQAQALADRIQPR